MVFSMGGVALLGACDAEDPRPPANWVSGKRIRVKTLDAGGGAVAFVGLVDHDSGRDCYFELASDGKTRCLPTGGSGNLYFTDAACTVPVAVVYDGGPCQVEDDSILVFPGLNDSTCGGSTVYQPGNVQIIDGPVFQKSSAGCIEQPDQTGLQVHALAEVPLTTFVAAHLEEEALSDDLVGEYWVADDGARIFDTLRNRNGNRGECFPYGPAPYEPFTAGPYDCEPSRAASNGTNAYADADCTEELGSYYDPGPGCSEPPVAFLEQADSTCGCDCGTVDRELGESVSPSAVFTLDVTGTCVRQSQPPPNGSYFRGGKEIAKGSHPKVEARLLGSGKLKLETFELGGAIVSQSRVFVDAAGVPCFPDDLGEKDVQRCISGNATYFNAGSPIFGDAACSMKIAPAVSSPCGPESTPDVVLGYESTQCGSQWTVYAVGDPFTGPTAYVMQPEGCVPEVDNAASYYVVGEQLGYDALPAIHVKTE